MSSPIAFIYSLSDPRTGEIRYIGKSVNPNYRLRKHIIRSKKEKYHRANWIRSLLSAGLKPVLDIVDEVPEDCWQALEAAYIQFFREDEGCDLVNSTPGGEAGPICVGRKHSLEARQKMRGKVPWNKGKKLPTDTRLKMSIARTGQKRSPESRDRMCLAAKLREARKKKDL